MKTLALLLLVACGFSEEDTMSGAPVRFPGSVLSRNSQTRAQALQAGAYAAAAAASPSTIGFGFFGASAPAASGEFRMGRIHGLLSDDVIVGYVAHYQGVVAAVVTGTLVIKVSLYQLDDGGVLRQIENTQASFNLGSPTPADHPNSYLFIPVAPVTVDPLHTIVAAVEFDYTAADWTQLFFTGFDALNFQGAAIKGTGGMPQTFIPGTVSSFTSAVVPSIAVVTQRNVFTPPNVNGGYVLF